MIQPFRLSAIAAFAAVLLLLLSPVANAQGMISRATLVKQRDDLLSQRATMKQLQAQTSAGNLLLVPNGDSVLPVSTDDYRKMREAKLFVKGDDAQNKAARARVDREIADLAVRSKTAVQSLASDLNKEINTLNGAIQTSNEVDDKGHRRTDADRIAEDFLTADDGSAPRSRPSPKAKNPNNLSPEELAESPAAPDAQSRTLTVDNTPPPPADGTPIVDASVAPPRTRTGMDGYDDAVDTTQAIAGIVVGIAGASSRHNGGRSNGNGGHRNNGGGNHPSPRPGGC